MPTGKRIRFIVTKDRADKQEVNDLMRVAEQRGILADLQVAGDGSRLAQEAAAAGFDAVVAIGGDGTVNAVVNGLAASSTALGILPLGTANDFAQQFDIPADTRAAIELLLWDPVVIDTASLNGRRFINVSTGGVGAETTAETPAELKDVLGPLAYAITGLKKLANLEPMHLRVSSPETTLECDALVFAVGNARATGGGSLLTPRASVTDGLLDVCIVEAMPAASLIALLPRLRAGLHVDDELVHYFQAKELTIEAERPVSVNVDGEPMSESRLEYRLHPSDLRVHLGRLPD